MNIKNVIEYLNDNIRWGTEIKRSKLNELVEKWNLDIDSIFLLYKEVSEMELEIIEDKTSAVSKLIGSRSNSWLENIKIIISGLPESFYLNDIYLFAPDLSMIHMDNRNIKAKIRQVLQIIRDSGDILFISNSKYKKVVPDVRGGLAVSDDDFDDFDDLDDLLNSNDFDKEYKLVKEIPDYSKNMQYISDFQRSHDVDYLDNILIANQSLVKRIAKEHIGQTTISYDFDDMIIEGTFGLKKAAEKFDLSLGYEFSTYATWWIRQAILRGVANQSTTIRIPVHAHEMLNKERRAENKLFVDLSRTATVEEIAAFMDMSVEKVREYRGFQYRFGSNLISLDTPIKSADSSTPLGEFIPEENTKDAFDVLHNIELTETIHRVLVGLPDRDREVIILRFGLENKTPHTLEQIGQKMGVSRERIRQIESKTLRKLRNPSIYGELKDLVINDK